MMLHMPAGALLLILAAPSFAESGGDFAVRPGSIIGGGGTSAAGGLVLEGAIGRGTEGESRGGPFTLSGGLWPAAASLGGASCAGDCGGDGRVTVDELVALVGIALDRTGPSACESGDSNRDGRVSIDELVAALRASLAACR